MSFGFRLVKKRSRYFPTINGFSISGITRRRIIDSYLCAMQI